MLCRAAYYKENVDEEVGGAAAQRTKNREGLFLFGASVPHINNMIEMFLYGAAFLEENDVD